MSQDPDTVPNLPVDPVPPVAEGKDEQLEQDAGDFITRHVLEKDSVFFEG